MPESRKLRVFLCHASQDKPVVRELYQRLLAEGWIDPWLDEEKLLPGQDWDLEIEKAVEASDAVIVCLSNTSITKEGYIQKEIRKVLDVADEKPEGTIFIIPLRIDDCQAPRRLKMWQWVNYFEDDGYEKIKKSLAQRFENLGEKVQLSSDLPNDLYKFIYFPAGHLHETQQFSRYPFWISKYPITNCHYKRFLKSKYFSTPHKGDVCSDLHDYWSNLPLLDKEEAQSKMGKRHTGNAGWKWLQSMIGDRGSPVLPRYWDDPDFGIARKNIPVVGITWYEASAYCRWLGKNWSDLEESKMNKEIEKQSWVRLPTRNEWEIAAGGKYPNERYPWDSPREITSDIREIFNRANVAYQIGRTTPVDKYLKGASPRGVMDMSGNVWEWLLDVHQAVQKNLNMMTLVGGSWSQPENKANLVGTNGAFENESANDRGFRVAIPTL